MSSLEEFNGTYVNEGDSLANALGLSWKDIDFITLEFETPKKLNISYRTDTGTVRITHAGKFKNNYFEAYLEKRRLIALVINSVITDKVRIGKNVEGSMFIHHTYSKFAMFVGLGGVWDEFESTYTHGQLDKDKIYPFEENGKWGYKTNSDGIIITPQYDFAKLFENDIAESN